VSLPRIGIDYTAAVHQTAGIGRYVREQTRALADLLPPAEVRLFVAGRPDRLPPPPGDFTYRLAAPSDLTLARLWHKARLPLPVEVWTGRVDLFHAMNFALPPTLPGTRTAVTLYDLSFEQAPDTTVPAMRAYLQRVVRRSAQRADTIIAISEATRRDVVELYGVEPDKVAVLYPGVEARFRPVDDPAQLEAVRRKYHIGGGPFVLTVGTLQPRKNHKRLIQALAGLDATARLVIAGGPGWAYDEVHAEVGRLSLDERVIFAGYVDDADLPALYSAAWVFAYPALYEGFGLPALEAMACATPVVASDVSSLPEVVGEAGLMVNPTDVDALAAALARLLDDDDLRRELIARGLERAATFTWERSARGLWAVYRNLLEIDKGPNSQA
jgi:glycosyltransferase involved in cell wall biosynthesis